MDKLKPILAQKFWILLGVGLIVSFVGWYMASGALATAIDKRTTEIKAARDSTNIGEIPNPTWPAAVEKINAEQSVLVDAAKYKLWQEETAVMEWPEPMIEFLQKATAYRGDMDPLAPTVYRNYYPPLKASGKRSGRSASTIRRELSTFRLRKCCPIEAGAI